METSASAAVMTGKQTYGIKTFAVPAIGPNDGLLRVERCGVCGTDAEEFDVSRVGYPVIPGHEPLGVIEKIGEEISERWGVVAGDRVFVESTVPCRSCTACLAGDFTNCQRKFNYGFRPTADPPSLWGGFAEYLYLHPNATVHKVSADVPLDTAILFNSLACGIGWAVHTAGTQIGDSVLVMGCGQRGLACVVAAKAAGARTVIVTGLGVDDYKLRVARELGADHVINVDQEDVIARVREYTDGRGVDRVVDVVPMATNTIVEAIAVARSGGCIVIAGHKAPGPIESLVMDDVRKKNLTIQGVLAKSTKAYEQAVALIESGAVRADLLHTHTFALEDAADSVRLLRGELAGEKPIAVSVDPWR